MTQAVDPRLYARQQALGIGSDEFYKYQLDFKEDMEDMMYDFLGYEWDDQEKKYVRSEKKLQLINSHGANALMTFLRPRVSRIFSLSNHDSIDSDRRCQEFAESVTTHLCRHMEEYEIRSYPIMDSIINLCDDVFRATMLKSLEGWEGDSIRKGHTTVESKETVIQSEGKGGIKLPFT